METNVAEDLVSLTNTHHFTLSTVNEAVWGITYV